MTNTIRSVIATTLLFSNIALAVTSEFQLEPFMQKGVAMSQSSLESYLKDIGQADDKICPAGGAELVQNLASSQGGLMDAMNSVSAIMGSVQPHMQTRAVENTRCGSCQQKNQVSFLATIAPEKISPVPECEAMPAETFTAGLNDQDEIKDYTESVLKGKNSEGQKMLAACPDPCAYYVTTAETPMENQKTHLTLTVQCGPPRKGSALFSNYNFKGGLIHQWNCSK